MDHHGQELPDGDVGGGEAVAGVGRFHQPALQRGQLAGPPDGVEQRPAQGLGIAAPLDDEVLRAVLHSGDAEGLVAAAGADDDRQRPGGRRRPGEGGEALGVGKVQVEDEDVEAAARAAVVAQSAEPVAQRRHRVDDELRHRGPAEDRSDQLGVGAAVLDVEHPDDPFHHRECTAGPCR